MGNGSGVDANAYSLGALTVDQNSVGFVATSVKCPLPVYM